MRSEPLTAWDDLAAADGCAYIVTNGHDVACGEHTLPGSSYCLHHHEICHLRHGSEAETVALKDIAWWQFRTIERSA